MTNWRDERPHLREITDWIEDRIAVWGGVCHTSDGQELDWGQAAAYMYYGSEWTEESMSDIPDDVLDILNEWRDDDPPEWFVNNRKAK